MSKKLLKATEVAFYINTCKSQVYKLVKQGRFPKPIKIGKLFFGIIGRLIIVLKSSMDILMEDSTIF